MKIIINENQIKFLNEDLNIGNDISFNLKESIALWCLINDFRFYIPNNIFGSKISVANSSEINKEICTDIMNGTLTNADEEKELFGYNDYDDFEDGDDEREEYMNENTIYKVETNDETYYIETSSKISEYDGETLIKKFEGGEIDEQSYIYDLLKWFYTIYK